MSEKTKTPREIAEECALREGIAPDFNWKEMGGESWCPHGESYTFRKIYLAGLKAGAKMGYVAGFEVGFSDNKAMTFDEWWASLNPHNPK